MENTGYEALFNLLKLLDEQVNVLFHRQQIKLKNGGIYNEKLRTNFKTRTSIFTYLGK